MAKCIHHWYLGASHHGTVHAKCLKCGAEKDYPPVVIHNFKFVSYPKDKKSLLHPKPQTVEDISLSLLTSSSISDLL